MLRAPIELENLLPYDISYKVFDKDSNHNWNSFLRKGGNTPVHSVDLNHLVLLSVKIQDSGKHNKPSIYSRMLMLWI